MNKKEFLKRLEKGVKKCREYVLGMTEDHIAIAASLIGLLIFILLISSCRGQEGEVPQPRNATSADSILRVRSVVQTSKGTVLNYGSGTVIQWGNDRVFLTANHVVRDNPRTVAVRINGQWQGVRELYRDTRCDLALYTAPPGVPAMDFGIANGMRKGTLLYIFGFGGNGQKSRTTVYLNRITVRGDVVCDGKVIDGDSGGPIATHDGVVIGFVWGCDGVRSYGVHGQKVAEAIDTISRRRDYGAGLSLMANAHIKPCQYIADETGCWSPNCPQPQQIQGNPYSPGYRQPIPDTPIVMRPQAPSAPVQAPAPSVAPEPTIVAGWLGSLSGKVDTLAKRLDATEKIVWFIGIVLVSGVVIYVVQAVARFCYKIFKILDRLDGKDDGFVNPRGLFHGIRARIDARDGTIDYVYPNGYSPSDRQYFYDNSSVPAKPVAVVPVPPAVAANPPAAPATK